MADENPNSPSSGVPPKPADAPKVQPKKETVRISLPPKPASTATIRLPTLPGGAKPPAAAAPRPAAPAASGAPVGVPPPTRPPATGAPAATVARPAVAVAAPAAAVSRPSPAATPAARPAGSAPARKKTAAGPLDTGLAIAAGVLGLAAVASLLLLLNMK